MQKTNLIPRFKISNKTLVFAGIVSFGVCVSSNNCTSYTLQQPTRQVVQQDVRRESDIEKKIAEYYGTIRVTFEDEKFTSFYRGHEMEVKSIPVSERKIKFESLSKELDKYDSSFLENHIEEVYFAQKIIVDGHRFGGIRSRFDLERVMIMHPIVFHAEFSSILFFKYKNIFPKKEWKKINPLFTYTENSDQVIDSPDYPNKPFANPELLQKGFITRYATTSVENDYNEIYKALYLRQARLFENCGKYPKLKQKTDLTIKFLSKVMQQELDKEYFLKLQM